MFEVEVKAPAEPEPVRDRLERLGASHTDTVTQRDTYYDAPHRSFVETDEALRIRRETGDDGQSVVELTYKGPRIDEGSKTRTEHELTVEDEETASALLEALGFTPAATVTKTRERYALGEYTVTLDAVEGLGEYVEVETMVTAESAVEPARTEALEMLESLGIDPSTTVRTAYLTMLQRE